MNASSTIPSTAASPEGTNPTCPTWRTTDHSRDAGEAPLHYGPKFGQHIRIEGYDGATRAAILELVDELTPAALRQLAADAVAAALWIERETGAAPSGPRFGGSHGDDLWHIGKIAETLGIDECEIRGLVESGKLVAVKIDGRTYATARAVGEYYAGTLR